MMYGYSNMIKKSTTQTVVFRDMVICTVAHKEQGTLNPKALIGP